MQEFQHRLQQLETEFNQKDTAYQQKRAEREKANRAYIRKWQIASAIMVCLTIIVYLIDWIVK